jgi:hypothetical protein
LFGTIQGSEPLPVRQQVFANQEVTIADNPERSVVGLREADHQIFANLTLAGQNQTLFHQRDFQVALAQRFRFSFEELDETLPAGPGTSTRQVQIVDPSPDRRLVEQRSRRNINSYVCRKEVNRRHILAQGQMTAQPSLCKALTIWV